MANVVVLIVLVVVAASVVTAVHRRRRGLVANRGTSIGADLGALADQQRVQVREVTRTGPDRLHVLLAADGEWSGPPIDLDFVVSLRAEDFGYDLLHEWQQHATVVAIVIPPGSRLVRLRATDDLQPLTLRRVD